MTTAQINHAADLYTQGLSLARIGERLGFNASTINTHLRNHGITIRGPHDRIR